MSTYRHDIGQLERRVHLSNDEVQLLYHLLKGSPVTLQSAMSRMDASEAAVRTLVKSLNTKLQPLGYRVSSVLDTGYVLEDTTGPRRVIQHGGGENMSHYD